MLQSKVMNSKNPFRAVVRASCSDEVRERMAGCVATAMFLVQAEGRRWTAQQGWPRANRNELLKTLNRSLISNGCKLGRADILPCGVPLRQVRGLVLHEVGRMKDKIKYQASPATASALGLGRGLREWKERYREARALQGEERVSGLMALLTEISVVETETQTDWRNVGRTNLTADRYGHVLAYTKGVQLLVHHARGTLRDIQPDQRLAKSIDWHQVEREYLAQYPDTVWLGVQSPAHTGNSHVDLPERIPARYVARRLLEEGRFKADNNNELVPDEAFQPDVSGHQRALNKPTWSAPSQEVNRASVNALEISREDEGYFMPAPEKLPVNPQYLARLRQQEIRERERLASGRPLWHDPRRTPVFHGPSR